MRTTRFSLRLLGGFEVTRDGRPLSDRCRGKMRALLAYLAVESSRMHSRQALGALLWPEQDEDHARQSVRQALTSLRSVLGDRDGSASLFRVDRESIGLNPDGPHEIDVAALEPVAPTGCAAGGVRSRASCRRCHQVAAALYRGPFLAGMSAPDAPEFESWLECKRQWFGGRAAEAFTHLAACYEQSGDPARALQYARAQLRVDPWNEEAHRQVIRLLAVGGRRNAAIAHYRHVCRVLADELGVEPEAQTRALYERARAGQIEPGVGLPVERLLRVEPSAPRVCPSAPPGHCGERRLLTVLSCEVRCAPEEDPEELYVRSGGCLTAAARLVRRQGGLVVESDGAGLTAYFGYPAPCDDASLQAVRAAVSILESAAGGQPLRLRVHSDIVFVPPRVRGACDTDASVVGTAPRFARALHAMAPEVDLALSANTYALVCAAVECRAITTRARADAGEPIVVHEVLRVVDAAGPVGPGADRASVSPESELAWPPAAGAQPGRPLALQITERIGLVLDRLGRSKALVQLASNLGPQFSARRLGQLLGRVGNLGLDPLTLAAELERLVAGGIFESETEGSASGYRFRQPLVREVAYRCQSRAQQRLYETLLAQLEADAAARAPSLK
jgi:DNA-binding SARP family transcriptional activator